MENTQDQIYKSKFQKAQKFFVSPSNDARIFTSFSHEMSLWSGATWPTVFTWSREDYYRKESGLIQPVSPPRYCLSPATGLSTVSRRPLLCPAYHGWSHLAIVPSFNQQSSGLEECSDAYLLLPRSNHETASVPISAHHQVGKFLLWRKTRMMRWAERWTAAKHLSGTLRLQIGSNSRSLPSGCCLCLRFKRLTCSHSQILLLHFRSQLKSINILFIPFNAAIKQINTLSTNQLVPSYSELLTLQFYFSHILKRSWILSVVASAVRRYWYDYSWWFIADVLFGCPH